MQCKNHPEVVAVDRCTGCAEPFCSDCLVTIHGQKYCGSCKTMTIRGELPVPENATIPCNEAQQALTFAIIGYFFFGLILGAIAISKAFQAKKSIAANPRLAGWGKANAAMVLGIIVIILSTLNLVYRLKSYNKTF